MYLPLEQIPRGAWSSRSEAGVPDVLAGATAAVHALDPDQPILDSGSVSQLISRSLSRQRFAMLLLGGFAALAIVLAAVGIYSVLAYGVRRRRGARSASAWRWARRRNGPAHDRLPGHAHGPRRRRVGLAAALALGRVLASLLYGVRASRPATYRAVAALLCVVALAASLLPAMRARASIPCGRCGRVTRSARPSTHISYS
jgi:putative ABC transport system permease protein